MKKRDLFVFLTGLIIVVCLLSIVVLISANQEIQGYNVLIEHLARGSSVSIFALSPSAESAVINAAASSEQQIFLFTGSPELIPVEEPDQFAYNGTIGLGEWRLIAGSNVTLKLSSEVPLKVLVHRNIEYFIDEIYLLFIGFFVIWLLMLAFIAGIPL